MKKVKVLENARAVVKGYENAQNEQLLGVATVQSIEVDILEAQRLIARVQSRLHSLEQEKASAEYHITFNKNIEKCLAPEVGDARTLLARAVRFDKQLIALADKVKTRKALKAMGV